MLSYDFRTSSLFPLYLIHQYVDHSKEYLIGMGRILDFVGYPAFVQPYIRYPAEDGYLQSNSIYQKRF